MAERDLERVREIERAAGRLFAEAGMTEVAAHEPASADELRGYVRGERAWVAVDEADVPLGFVRADVVDGSAYIAELSVVPEFQRRGLGRRLVDEVAGWARARGLTALTLTTFRKVPWNARYYERLGFGALGETDLPPGLATIREREAERGLDREGPRVAMRRDLAG